MSTTPAGWYPDPADSAMQRWWDSTQWGPQIRPADPPTPELDFSSVLLARDVFSVGAPDFSRDTDFVGESGIDRFRSANVIGLAGVALSLVSVVWDPFIATGLLGIILCILGLARDADRRQEVEPTWGGRLIAAGLLLGCASTVVYGVLLLGEAALLIS